MGFFTRLFKKDEQERQVKSINDLLVGDIIVLTDSFALPERIRQQQFQITAINSYEFEHTVETEWVLTGTDDTELFLSLDIDDKTHLKFSLKIQHNDVESLFDLDEFSHIFDEPGEAFLTRVSDTPLSTGWTSPEYQQQVFAKVGFFHRKDHRHEKLSAYEGKDSGEQFELYQLFDAEQTRGIDVEVWEDGDTEICLTLYRPTTDIIDMFPGT